MDEKAPTDARAAAQAGEQGRPTLKTIAFMTGLGVTTVSRALKDAPEIGVETKRRVQLVAQQVGYRPNRAGVRLRTGKTNVISLILDTQEQVGGFVSDIIYGISEQLAQTPYHLVVTPYSRNNDPMEPVRYVVETGSADAIIISRTQPNDPRVRYMAERGFPFAAHGRTAMNVDHPFHDFDNHAFAGIAVKRLAEIGRKRLALLAPPAALSYHHHMRSGFLDGLAEAGLNEIPFSSVTNDDSIERIRLATIELMQRATPPDGIVSSAGAATFALVAGIEAAGLKLGRDIDVVSKQSFRLLPMFRRELHVVDEDVRLAGRELARAATGSINGVPVENIQSLVVPTDVKSPPH
ncbi:LacI family transcriptional regulator [Arvimicrobium flavum]|uniref:LacI family transcriptional regulator n=1 Tax=Arvimicrobium flavum TaxID=3393320 RepID=UPI00237AFBCC|nr:LacI family transcriptional regulator [Mesorhizobium shangrilense]